MLWDAFIQRLADWLYLHDALGRGRGWTIGVSGGPDYWRVARLTPGDTLNVRAAPGAGSRKIGELANGERVRNLGCHMVGSSKWCRIEVGTDMRFIGWVNGRYLVEG